MLNRKLLYYISLAVVVLVLAMLTQQVNALFRVEKTIKNNIIRTGYLDLEVSPIENMITANELMPGQNTGGSFTVKNIGNAAANLALSVKKSVGYTALYESLMATITSNNNIIYNGLLSEMQNISITSKPINTNEQKEYQITILLPENADSKLDNIYTNLTFTIIGEQFNG